MLWDCERPGLWVNTRRQCDSCMCILYTSKLEKLIQTAEEAVVGCNVDQGPSIVARDVVVDERRQRELALGQKPLQLVRLPGKRRGVENAGQLLGAVAETPRHGRCASSANKARISSMTAAKVGVLAICPAHVCFHATPP